MTKVRIEVHETDGLDYTDRVVHLKVPTGDYTSVNDVAGAKGMAEVIEAASRLARTIGLKRPNTHTVTFHFHVS